MNTQSKNNRVGITNRLKTYTISLLLLVSFKTYSQQDTSQTDYSKVLQAFDGVVSQAIFDPRLLKTDDWKKFRKIFGNKALKASSDTDFITAFKEARKNVNLFSHFSLIPKSVKTAETNDIKTKPKKVVEYQEYQDEIGLLTIRSFFADSLSEMINKAIDQAINDKVGTLIIDLRDNPGGNFKAWPVLSRLAQEITAVGHLVAGKWFITHENPPSQKDIDNAVTQSIPDLQIMISDLMDDGLLVLGVAPEAPLYKGDVYILINSKTASTSEVVAGALQLAGIATLIGEKSAGEVLNANQVPISSTLTLQIPIADVFLSNHQRIEGNGILPDYSTHSKEALNCAINLSKGADDC